VSVPFIVPSFAAALLLVASLLVFFFGKRTDTATIHLTNVSLCFMFFLAFIGSLIVGALVFPVLIVGADTCRSMDNLLHRVALETLSEHCYSPTTGKPWADAVPLDSAATYAREIDGCDIHFLRSNITVNLLQTMQDLAHGSCDTENTIDALWTSVGEFAADLPINFITSRVGLADDDIFGPVQPQWAMAVNASAAALSTALTTVTSEFARIFGCQYISAAYTTVRDATCCNVFDAAYWMGAGWFMLIFITIFCGIPGAVLGRKRFQSAPWGPMYETHSRVYKEQGAVDDGLDECGPSSLPPPPRPQLQPKHHKHHHHHDRDSQLNDDAVGVGAGVSVGGLGAAALALNAPSAADDGAAESHSPSAAAGTPIDHQEHLIAGAKTANATDPTGAQVASTAPTGAAGSEIELKPLTAHSNVSTPVAALAAAEAAESAPPEPATQIDFANAFDDSAFATMLPAPVPVAVPAPTPAPVFDRASTVGSVVAPDAAAAGAVQSFGDSSDAAAFGLAAAPPLTVSWSPSPSPPLDSVEHSPSAVTATVAPAPNAAATESATSALEEGLRADVAAAEAWNAAENSHNAQ